MRNCLQIVAIAAMLLALAAGCASSKPNQVYDANNPAIRISLQGTMLHGEIVRPETIPERLEDLDIPHESTIHIRLDPEVKNLQYPRLLMAILARQGYQNVVLVTERHAESRALGKKPKSYPRAKKTASGKTKIQYNADIK